MTIGGDLVAGELFAGSGNDSLHVGGSLVAPLSWVKGPISSMLSMVILLMVVLKVTPLFSRYCERLKRCWWIWG